MTTTDRILNQRLAGIDSLFPLLNDTIIVNESVVLNAMKVANLDFFGAIDTQDQDNLFDFFGISFHPASNQGENKWELVKS